MSFLAMDAGTGTIYIVVLLVMSALFYFVEICTPSLGLLACIGIALEVGAISVAFAIGTTLGFIMIFACLVGTPVFLYLMMKHLPGILVLKKDTESGGGGTPDASKLSDLIGKTGETLSTLRPVGKVRVDGVVVDARAERGMIDQNEQVEVISAGGTDVVVRSADARNNNNRDNTKKEDTQEKGV